MRRLPHDEQNLVRIVQEVNQLGDGKVNSIGEVTLTANQASTTVENPVCGASSVVLLMPKTASAATEVGAGFMYITPDQGEFVITHVNSATADRTFNYVILG